MKKKRLKKKIPTPNPAQDQDAVRLQFSFKHLDADHPRFRMNDCSQEFLRTLLLQIKIYSEYTEEQFTDENNDDRRHKNFWADTSEPDGFTHLGVEMQNEYSWQFALNSPYDKDSWRVHGMLVDNIFYVVWLDPDHALGAQKSRNAPTLRSNKTA